MMGKLHGNTVINFKTDRTERRSYLFFHVVGLTYRLFSPGEGKGDWVPVFLLLFSTVHPPSFLVMKGGGEGSTITGTSQSLKPKK